MTEIGVDWFPMVLHYAYSKSVRSQLLSLESFIRNVRMLYKDETIFGKWALTRKSTMAGASRISEKI